MHVWEVLNDLGGEKQVQPKRATKTGAKKNRFSDVQSNTRKLRSKERELNARKPISPVAHRP